ncbi:heme-binding domain-containing protein [Roseivirga echinicomitans]
MKKLLKTSTVLFFLLSISMSVISKPEPGQFAFSATESDEITFPENIQTIIEAKCMSCHKPDSRNTKAKEKLQWELVSKMSKKEQVSLIAELFEVIEEGKMPPAKSVERNPEIKLTEDETKALLAWLEVEEKRVKGK